MVDKDNWTNINYYHVNQAKKKIEVMNNWMNQAVHQTITFTHKL